MPERRAPIICDKCGHEMAFAKEVLYSTKGEAVYLTYICPHRDNETGCGAQKRVRFEKEPEVQFKRTKANLFLLA